jgi:hypothetical protein
MRVATPAKPVSVDVNKVTAAVGAEVRKHMRQGAEPTTLRARRAENLATLQRLGVIGEEEAKSLGDLIESMYPLSQVGNFCISPLMRRTA